MKPSIEIDAADLTDILEGFVTKLPKMTEADMIDLAARLKPAAKHLKTIDEYVKQDVKERLKHHNGARLGTLFKAVLKLIPCERLDQTALKEGHPKIHAMYCKEAMDERVTFEVR